jgi:hypothetical protein
MMRRQLAAGARSKLAQRSRAAKRSVADRLEEFERTLIGARWPTGGHRMEAAQWLGWDETR